MASTYSTNLKIDLMGTGDQDGTWGTVTNTNLGTLIEQAISGYVTQAITDGSGANTTITIPDGATGVARNMFIEMTGALTFSTTSLIVPANKKLYFIYNNTTGGFAVTVKVTGLTGVSVPNGRKVILVCNGTDIVEAHNAISGNATVGGTLVVTGATTASSFSGAGTGLTGTAASLTAGNVTTNANLTGAVTSVGNATSLGSFTSAQLAAAVTGETGTGALVFATSPALVTPALGTPASGSLTSCTGLPIDAGTTGTLSVARGGTGVTSNTGSGSVVLSNSPSLTSPALGTPSSGNLSNCTNLPIVSLTAGVTGTLPVANGGTGVTGSTGSGSVVLSNSPSLTSPALGTPSSGNLSNCSSLPIDAGTTGVLPVARGGTGVQNSTGSGSYFMLNTNPDVDGSGISYPDAATYMGVGSNSIAFGWGSPYVYVSVDNSVSGTFVNLSDYRIKKDVKDFTSDATSIIDSIRVVDYEILELDGTQSPEKAGIRMVGVIAHELQELIPDAVTGKKDAVNVDGTLRYQSVNYDAVVPFLIKTIQELTARIEKLEG